MWIYTQNWGITHPGLSSWILLYPLVSGICIPFPLAGLLLKLCQTLFPHSLYELSPPLGQNFVGEKKKGKLTLLKFQFRLHSQIYLCFSFILQRLQVFIYVVFRCFGCNKYREWATRKNQVLWTCFSCIGPSFYINHGILGMGTTFSSSMVLSHLKKSLEWSDMLKFSLIFYL